MGKYLDIIRKAEETQKPAVSPGSSITWEAADGTILGPAVVDFIHVTDDGSQWAFVMFPNGHWAAVHTKYLLDSNEGGSRIEHRRKS